MKIDTKVFFHLVSPISAREKVIFVMDVEASSEKSVVAQI